jgi:hypothetical protein
MSFGGWTEPQEGFATVEVAVLRTCPRLYPFPQSELTAKRHSGIEIFVCWSGFGTLLRSINCKWMEYKAKLVQVSAQPRAGVAPGVVGIRDSERARQVDAAFGARKIEGWPGMCKSDLPWGIIQFHSEKAFVRTAVEAMRRRTMYMVDLPKEFFTPQAMLTLTGAAGATYVIANGFQSAFNFNPRWLALVIAQTICLFGVYVTHGAGSDYFVGVVNGFLVYCTAAGGTALAGRQNSPTGRGPIGPQAGTVARRSFSQSWF